MKRFLSLTILIIGFSIIVSAQQYQFQKTVTNAEIGVINNFLSSETPAIIQDAYSTGGSSKAPGINWQYTDPGGIGSKVIVSNESGYTFNTWTYNDQRVSLYRNTASPEWESTVTAEFEFPIDMTPDGAFLAVAFDSVVQVFSSSTQNLVWEKITTVVMAGVKINEDGTMVYVVENMPSGQGKCSVVAYEVGKEDAVWETDFSGEAVTFAASGDCSKLVLCQYPGNNRLWVINGEDGAVIFDAYYKNQNPPALSYDGNILLTGDYSGYAHVYEYQEALGTYTKSWTYKVGGGGTSAWVVGMGVSADGSTLAIGTLVFVTDGFDGEVYLFNTYSPEPLWVFEHCGDQVSSVSLSDDGSLIAAGGYGSLDHSTPDFFLFRKQSASPLLDINTNGSFNSVSLSSDGTLCSVTGKAVHARTMGSGGILYNVNSDPGGGTLTGTVNVENAKIEVLGIDDYYTYSPDEDLYQIKYIPSGTYSVKASKVGYFPVIVDDVLIADGAFTTENFTLEATGNPPTDLMASNGAGYSIYLDWNYEDPDNVLGYKIYRKNIAENQFPEEPIATVGNMEFSYDDADVLPLNDYYYAVTAILEEDVQSPYSNVAEGSMADGFVIDEISVYHGTTPIIDGTIEEGEWDDAFEMDASDFLGTYDNTPCPVGSVIMFYKTNEAMTELYVACINLNDSVLEDHDEVALYIDDNNDGFYPVSGSGDDSEGNYWAAYYAAGNQLKFRPIYSNGGTGDIFYLENPQLEISDATGAIVYEFMIPIGDDETWKISPNENMQSGMFLFVLDDPSAFDGYWPCQNLQIFEPSGYGTMTFDAVDGIPAAPDGTSIWWDLNVPPLIILSWNQPNINDFDYFNVYCNQSGTFEILAETEGTQLYYYADDSEYKEFYVTTVDKGGNESEPSAIMIFDINLGVLESVTTTDISIYPNPSSQDVNITLLADYTSSCTISIYNAEGSLVAEVFNSTLSEGTHNFRWSTQGAKPGVYFLKIKNERTCVTRKFMVIR
jgi:Secretion system C-terminal sorting domain